jgi:hypothetical protein
VTEPPLPHDAEYVAARKVLLDALIALAPMGAPSSSDDLVPDPVEEGKQPLCERQVKQVTSALDERLSFSAVFTA